MIVLDGALGTELTRRGIDTTLPLWSARALIDHPADVQAIHHDHAQAGAQILTANTFRTNPRTLTRAGLGHLCQSLPKLAIALARAEAKATGARVAGSLAPVEDCYTPELVPDDDALHREHLAHAEALAEGGADLLLVETMNTIREAEAGCRAANAVGLPLWVSFTVAPDGNLHSGETLHDAVRAMLDFRPEAVLVNCLPVAQVASALDLLRPALVNTGVMFGAYANVGHVDDVVGWTLTHAVSPDAYASAARGWLAQGASVIGGCCGTLPAHIAAVAALAQ